MAQAAYSLHHVDLELRVKKLQEKTLRGNVPRGHCCDARTLSSRRTRGKGYDSLGTREDPASVSDSDTPLSLGCCGQ